MSFKERYTTADLKTKGTEEQKLKESKKIEVNEEAFLLADMINELIRKIEHARVSR